VEDSNDMVWPHLSVEIQFYDAYSRRFLLTKTNYYYEFSNGRHFVAVVIEIVDGMLGNIFYNNNKNSNEWEVEPIRSTTIEFKWNSIMRGIFFFALNTNCD